MSANYKKSGVDIDQGNKLVDIIKPLAKKTNRLGSLSGIGGFGALFDIKKCNFKDPILVSSTDGVGTKLKLAIAMNKHDTIGIDLVAMSVNDIVVQGAEPLFFLDYFACSKLDNNIAGKVIEGIAKGCEEAGCALVGGETAEMPGMYSNNEYDLAGFVVGAVERDMILPKELTGGDVIIGISSSGFHSNGYSLVRYILNENNIDFDKKFENSTIGEELLKPTRIYVKICLELIKKFNIKAFSHITGGGIVENIPRVLGSNKMKIHDIEMPEIFKYIQKLGNVENQEMLRTFNCGIGMAVICSKKEAENILDYLNKSGYKSYIIGEVI